MADRGKALIDVQEHLEVASGHIAGLLVVLTLGLRRFTPLYLLLGTAAVDHSVVFAGVSDICMMGSTRALMPWNRTAKVAA